ncbi:MAG: lipid II flippase MurJ, partial [Bacteroidota bacterium]
AATTQFDDPFGMGAITLVPVESLNTLLLAAVVGALVGGVLQFAVQLPLVFRLIRGFRLSVSTKVEGVKEAGKAFGPVVAGRGVAQVSGYVDTVLAGFAAAGTLGSIRPALMLYILPISLFGMSVAASELPELSRISQSRLAEFLGRVDRSMRQMLYLIVPTVVGYLGFGLVIVTAFFGGGAFGEQDAWLVTLILGGYTLGLGATSVSRLLQNSFYALGDTKTPATIAVARVMVSGVVGAGLMFALDRVDVASVVPVDVYGNRLTMAAVGLAIGASIGAWLELLLLRRALRQQAEGFSLPAARVAQMLGLAGLAAIPAALVLAFVPEGTFPPFVDAVVVVGLYGLVYLAAGHRLGFQEGEAWIGRFLRRARR